MRISDWSSDVCSADLSNDQRYQAKSSELDGFNGWEPSDRGWLVRLGPATYRLRKLTVNIGNLYVNNPDGYDGDPEIGLAPTITTDHSWDRSEEHTSELQSLMRISYAVFCLKKKKKIYR